MFTVALLLKLFNGKVVISYQNKLHDHYIFIWAVNLDPFFHLKILANAFLYFIIRQKDEIFNATKKMCAIRCHNLIFYFKNLTFKFKIQTNDFICIYDRCILKFL
jgi:hypothetical protein